MKCEQQRTIAAALASRDQGTYASTAGKAVLAETGTNAKKRVEKKLSLHPIDKSWSKNFDDCTSLPDMDDYRWDWEDKPEPTYRESEPAKKEDKKKDTTDPKPPPGDSDPDDDGSDRGGRRGPKPPRAAFTFGFRPKREDGEFTWVSDKHTELFQRWNSRVLRVNSVGLAAALIGKFAPGILKLAGEWGAEAAKAAALVCGARASQLAMWIREQILPAIATSLLPDRRGLFARWIGKHESAINSALDYIALPFRLTKYVVSPFASEIWAYTKNVVMLPHWLYKQVYSGINIVEYGPENRPVEPVQDHSMGWTEVLCVAACLVTAGIALSYCNVHWRVRTGKDYDTFAERRNRKRVDNRPEPLSHTVIKYDDPNLKHYTRQLRLGPSSWAPLQLWTWKGVYSEELVSHLMANNVAQSVADYSAFLSKAVRVIETFHNLNLDRGDFLRRGNTGRHSLFVAKGLWHRDRQQTDQMDF